MSEAPCPVPVAGPDADPFADIPTGRQSRRAANATLRAGTRSLATRTVPPEPRAIGSPCTSWPSSPRERHHATDSRELCRPGVDRKPVWHDSRPLADSTSLPLGLQEWVKHVVRTVLVGVPPLPVARLAVQSARIPLALQHHELPVLQARDAVDLHGGAIRSA